MFHVKRPVRIFSTSSNRRAGRRQLHLTWSPPMTMIIERRSADIGFVDEIWRGSSQAKGSFVSGAAIYWELAVTHNLDGAVSVTLRGPETRATTLSYGCGGTWWGIRFRMGAHLAHLSNLNLVNEAIPLPVKGDQAFTLNGIDVPVRRYEDAEDTVHRLITAGLLVADPAVDAAWQGSFPPVSQRSLQRRFRQVTGLSHRTARQIDRASLALHRLRQGTSILDTVDELGFSDQAHLTRSLRRWTGLTPAQVVREGQPATMA
jgi:hypothetical protein